MSSESERLTGPKCIGVILDGNRRYAKEHGLPPLEGHRRGFEKVKDIARWAKERGVQEIIFYAFSTENWNRAPEEVAYLMDLFESYAKSWSDELLQDNVRVRFIGERNRLRLSLQKELTAAEEKTKDGTEGTIVIALSYGGRAEILAGIQKLIDEGVTEVHEEIFSKTLWSADISDPDLIIRTSGEQRLSNFLTWQSVYSELYFTDTKLPALTKDEFNEIIDAYLLRERRHGT